MLSCVVHHRRMALPARACRDFCPSTSATQINTLAHTHTLTLFCWAFWSMAFHWARNGKSFRLEKLIFASFVESHGFDNAAERGAGGRLRIVLVQSHTFAVFNVWRTKQRTRVLMEWFLIKRVVDVRTSNVFHDDRCIAKEWRFWLCCHCEISFYFTSSVESSLQDFHTIILAIIDLIISNYRMKRRPSKIAYDSHQRKTYVVAGHTYKCVYAYVCVTVSKKFTTTMLPFGQQQFQQWGRHEQIAAL